MQKIAFVFGTRPEVIKLAPLIQLFKNKTNIKVEVCATGQHRDMLTNVFDIFQLKPDIDLALMSHNQGLSEFVAKSIVKLDNYIKDSQPDYIVVQGDTSTVLAASLGAYYNKKKVLHVEAGLRTSNLYSPFPEEMNRRLTTQLCYYHFAPTEQAKSNLLKEGIDSDQITVVGNTSIDSLMYVSKMIKDNKLQPIFDSFLKVKLQQYEKMVLITGHRRENLGDGFIRICRAIKEMAKMHSNCLFVYPVHLNPNVREVVFEMLSHINNVCLIPPQPYVEFISLMHRSYLILTDSGGIQEEAPSLKKPVLVMRENTERPEGIESGCSILVGTDPNRIINEVTRLMVDKTYYTSFFVKENPYGNGTAAEKIASVIERWS